MNRSRALLRSALAGLAMIALAGVASTAHAQAPTTADPAAATTAPAATAPAATAPASTAPSTTAPSTNAGATPASTAPDVTLDAPSPSHRTAWPWIIIGAGIALVVTATVLEVHAVSEDDQRQNAEIKLTGLSPGDPQHQPLVDSAASHDKSATTSRTEALIIGSVGFVAIAGAVVLWFVEGGSSASASSANGAPANAAHAKRTMPSIVPQATPGYAGAMLGASF
jgi:hypothetical protein